MPARRITAIGTIPEQAYNCGAKFDDRALALKKDDQPHGDPQRGPHNRCRHPIAAPVGYVRCKGDPGLRGAGPEAQSDGTVLLAHRGRRDPGRQLQPAARGIDGGEAVSNRTYYFAARYSSHPELRKFRDELVVAIPNTSVTSRWIDCHPDVTGGLENSLTPGELASDPAGCWRYGRHDIEDLEAALCVVSFANQGGKGGRHVEFGYALAAGKRLVLIGNRENVFHTHPTVEQYDTWGEFLARERESV